LVGPSHGGVAKRRGVQRDLFNRRMTVQLRRFARGLSARIQRWAERHELRLVVLAGPAEMVEAIFAEMPETFRERVALVRDNLSRLSPPKLQARLGPELDRWMRAYEAAQVEALIGEGSRRAVVGLDDTLARLPAPGTGCQSAS
jgi:hypothetical protein